MAGVAFVFERFERRVGEAPSLCTLQKQGKPGRFAYFAARFCIDAVAGRYGFCASTRYCPPNKGSLFSVASFVVRSWLEQPV